jgi:ABC-type sulfate/molybdate transport systems ATPase subunit
MSALIEVDLRRRLEGFDLNAAFRSDARLTALFGKSGAGKTTVINIIAGLIRPDSGRVIVKGETLIDSARGVFAPKHRRRIGYVFQDARLFPHLNVRQNLLYGRWFAPSEGGGMGVDQVIALLGLVGMGMQMEALRRTAVVHVIAIKRLSTLLSAMVGVVWLGEPRGALRLPAACLMLAGAALVLRFAAA